MTVLAPRPTAGAREDLAPLPRAEPLVRLPILTLLVHERCDCRCRMCDIWQGSGQGSGQGPGQDTGGREISVETVASWLPEWRRLGVERVVLSGGEPLLHSDLAGLGRVLREAGLGVTLITTGLELGRRAGVVARFCDDVVVSLDGPHDLHDRIRNVPRAYERLSEGVASLRATGGPVRISGRCTVQRTNCGALRATVAAARELGLDGISFLAADVSSEAFNRPGGWPAGRARKVALDHEALSRLGAELDGLETACAAELSSGFIAEPPAKLRRRLYDYFAALLGEGDLPPVRCNAPWVSAVIEVDGTVKPCFFQPTHGNVHDSGTLGPLLNSAAATSWRRSLNTDRDRICRRCVCSLELRAPAAVGAR